LIRVLIDLQLLISFDSGNEAFDEISQRDHSEAFNDCKDTRLDVPVHIRLHSLFKSLQVALHASIDQLNILVQLILLKH